LKIILSSISSKEWRRACNPSVEGLARKLKVSSMASPVPAATAINTYSRLYEEMNWAAKSVFPARIICKFTVPTKGIYKLGQQLHHDYIRSMWNEMPHAYVTLVKDDQRIVFLYCASLHNTPLGATPEPWNNKLMMFTGDVASGQASQVVLLPAMTNQTITVYLLNQQLLNFQMDDDLQVQDPVGEDIPEATSESIWT
jgi:hypothetical protein